MSGWWTIIDLFDVVGESFTVGGQYRYGLLRTPGESHVLTFGAEFKSFMNTIDFFGTNIGVDIMSFPTELGYEYSGSLGPANFFGRLGLVHNLPIGARNDDDAYRRSRAGADASWSALRANAAISREIGGGWQGSCGYRGNSRPNR